MMGEHGPEEEEEVGTAAALGRGSGGGCVPRGFTEGLFAHHLEENRKGLQRILTTTHHHHHYHHHPRRNEFLSSEGFLKEGKRTFLSSSSGRSGSKGGLWGLKWPLPLRTLWVCCLWVLLTTPTNTCADSNGCDFYGSGLEQDGRGVQPVYLSCSSGRVEWQYPRAGLRVILKSPHKDKDFHACIKADLKFEGARIYLEGHRSLLPLFAVDDGRPKELVRCFTSYKGQVALYVEAEPGTDDLKKQVAAFEYDLQSLSKGAIYDPLEECRPCTEEELLRLYCSADFVARGIIVGTEDDSRLSRTTITIKASKLFQQTSPVFRHSFSRKKASQHNPSYSHQPTHNAYRYGEAMSNSLEADVEEEEEFGYIGLVDVPIECGARAGEGEFLVMGVVRLGQPVLKCAPRHSEWVKLARTAHARAQCVIET